MIVEYAIAGGVVVVSGLLVAGLCRVVSRGDHDDPPQSADTDPSVLFQIPPTEETEPS